MTTVDPHLAGAGIEAENVNSLCIAVTSEFGPWLWIWGAKIAALASTMSYRPATVARSGQFASSPLSASGFSSIYEEQPTLLAIRKIRLVVGLAICCGEFVLNSMARAQSCNRSIPDLSFGSFDVSGCGADIAVRSTAASHGAWRARRFHHMRAVVAYADEYSGHSGISR